MRSVNPYHHYLFATILRAVPHDPGKSTGKTIRQGCVRKSVKSFYTQAVRTVFVFPTRTHVAR